MTPQQHRLLTHIVEYIRQHGIPPSARIMAMAIGLKSTSGVIRLLNGLEEAGYIRRRPYRARSIEILRLPPDLVGSYSDLIFKPEDRSRDEFVRREVVLREALVKISQGAFIGARDASRIAREALERTAG